jgi:hypothetical protein
MPPSFRPRRVPAPSCLPARLLAAPLTLLAVACSGTTVPYTFEGEPVCPDYAIGTAAPIRGGLKRPLHVSFKSGGDVVARVVLVGLRTADSPATPILLPDTDAEYDVEWAECENERAPAPAVAKALQNSPENMKYECGEAKPYATVKVTTTKGDAKRKIAVAPPPSLACWSADGAPGGSAPPSASAAPVEAPPPPEVASAAPSASAAPAASAAPSASAAAAAPPAPAPVPPAPRPPAPTTPAPTAPPPTAPAPPAPAPPAPAPAAPSR